MERKTASAIMLTLLLTSMLMLAFNIQPVKSEPGTIIVPDDYPTIQEAINNANDGDTIFVRNGTYYEHVVVNKTVSLIGENRETAIIDGNGTGKVVHIVVDNVNITQFTIRNSGSDYPDGGGIYISDSRGCNVIFNILKNNYYGIWLWSSSHNYLMNNVAFNNSCGGIELRGGHKNILIGNNLSGNLRGINIPGSSDNLITNNTATHNIWDGIHAYSYSSYNVFANNNLSNNGFSGIDLDSYSSNNNLTGNTIYNNSEEGIRIGLRCMFNALTDNSIMDGKKGIHLYDWANNNTLISNSVSSNQYGIWFDSWPSSNNTIFHNNFVNNSNQVYIKEQINNIWDDGYPSGGNYWSDYTGVDLNRGPYQNETGSDGIGDTPYILDSNNQDNYPLMKLWKPTIDWWPMYQHDLQHTGYSTSKIPNNLASLWNFSDREDAYCSAPVVYDGMVFVNIFGPWIANGTLWALNETNGAPIWSFPMGPMPYNSPTISEDKIFVGGNDGRFYCLNLNGDLVWNFTCEYNPYQHGISQIWSSPAIDSGKVYFLTEGGFFYALNITNGQVVWVYRTPCIVLEESSPAIWNGMIYFGSVAGEFRAVNATDGSEIWKFATGNYATSGPTVIEGKAYIGSTDSNFYCTNATNGALIWNFTSGGPIFYAPAVFEDKVFFSDRQGWYGESSKLYALKTSDGTPLWNVTIDIRVRTNAIVAAGKVFVGSPGEDGAHLYAFNLTNGALIWHYTTTGSWKLGCSFAISNNKLFVGSDKVYAFGELAMPPATYSLTVAATVGGITNPTAGTYTYADGTSANVSATPDTGYQFGHWVLDGSPAGSMNPTSVLMTSNHTLQAVFVQITYQLTIQTTTGGTTNPAPGAYTHNAGASVPVTAVLDVNYKLDHWELDGSNYGSANPYTVLMDNNHALKAVFTYSPPPPPLSASINPLSGSILVGQSVTFTSTVSGGYTPYSYQWYLNGNPVSGATSASWTFTPTTSGIYYAYLKVTDAKANTAQSDAARITVATVPVGGYSFPIQVQTKTEPIIPYIALVAALAAIFTKLRPKTKRKR